MDEAAQTAGLLSEFGGSEHQATAAASSRWWDRARPSPRFAAALSNQLKSVFGTGLLAMPYAILTVGVPAGVLLTIFVGVLSIYTMHLLACCTIIADGPPYSELVRRAFGDTVGHLVTAKLMLHQIAVCAAYFVFVGENLREPLGLETSSQAIIALTVPFVLLCWLHDMQRLMATSALGTATMLLSLLLVLREASLQAPARRAQHLWEFELPSASHLASFAGVALFTFAGHSETVAIVQSLGEERERYGRIALFVAFSCIPVVTCVAVTACVGFGSRTAKNILLNVHSSSGTVLKLTLSAVAFLSMPVKMFPASQIAEDVLLAGSAETAVVRSRALRATLALTSTALALFLPDFEFLVALIGTFCMGIIAFVVPPFMYCSLGRKSLGRATLVAHGALGVFGVGATLGSTALVLHGKFGR